MFSLTEIELKKQTQLISDDQPSIFKIKMHAHDTTLALSFTMPTKYWDLSHLLLSMIVLHAPLQMLPLHNTYFMPKNMNYW